MDEPEPARDENGHHDQRNQGAARRRIIVAIVSHAQPTSLAAASA